MKMNSEQKELNIFDLNDDCLMAICELLESKDLFGLYQSHSRFHHAIAGAVNNVCVKLSTSDFKTTKDKEHLDNFFKLCGDRIKKIKFYVDSTWTTINIGQLINNYCANGNVKNCTFSNFNFTFFFIRSNFQFFRSLKSLCLCECDMNKAVFIMLMKAIDGIKEFSIDRNRDWFDTVQMLTKFTTFELDQLTIDYWALLSRDELSQLKVNSSVKQLNMLINNRNEFLLQHFAHVTSLELKGYKIYDNSILTSILKLKNLKKLSLRFSTAPETDIEPAELQSFLLALGSSNTLDALTLDLTEINDNYEICQTLCQITNLKKLCLYTEDICFNSLMLGYARNLSKLQVFEIFIRDAYFDVTDEEVMLEFVELAKNLKSLSFRVFNLNSSLVYHQFYESLARIRENQSSKFVLNVEIFDRQLGPIFIQKTKWVQMRINDDFCYF